MSRVRLAELFTKSAPERKPQRKPQHKAKPVVGKPRSAAFGKDVLKFPPIRHLGDDTSVGLDAFEFALAGTITIWARQQQRQDTGEVVVIRVSARQLLRWAGRAWNSNNQNMVRTALERLKLSIGQFPPVLFDWNRPELSQTQRTAKLRLVVNKGWLPKKAFDRVPWPPPARPTTLTLYLFLFGCDVRPEVKTDISFDRLYHVLGIVGSPSHARRALEQALKGVNAHLARLADRGQLGRDFPTRFKLVAGDDRVRAVAVYRDEPVYPEDQEHRGTQVEDQGDDDEEAAEQEHCDQYNQLYGRQSGAGKTRFRRY